MVLITFAARGGPGEGGARAALPSARSYIEQMIFMIS